MNVRCHWERSEAIQAPGAIDPVCPGLLRCAPNDSGRYRHGTLFRPVCVTRDPRRKDPNMIRANMIRMCGPRDQVQSCCQRNDQRPGASRTRHVAAATVLMLAIATPVWAQQSGNPFQGRAAGGRGPYGSDAGATTHIMQLPQLAQAAGAAAAGQPRATAGVVVQEGERTEPLHRPETAGTFWEILFASCAGGAFLGGATALSSMEVVTVGTAAVAPAGLALPALAGATASAAGIGCALGASTAAISLGAAALWQRVFR